MPTFSALGPRSHTARPHAAWGAQLGPNLESEKCGALKPGAVSRAEPAVRMYLATGEVPTDADVDYVVFKVCPPLQKLIIIVQVQGF